MNIRFVIAKSILYFLIVAAVASFFSFSVLFVSQQLEIQSRVSQMVVIMIASLIIVLGIDPLKRFLAKITDDIFYKDKINYQKVLNDISIIIAREIDLEILLSSLRSLIKTQLKVKAADILVKKNSTFVSIDPQQPKSFSEHSVFIDFLASHREAVIVEELYRRTSDMPESKERAHNQEILDELERNGIEFFAPVYLEGELKAIIILAQKQSGDIYTGEDIGFFQGLAPQIAVAIEKSQLYESIGEFNLELQNKINRATQELKEKNIQLEEKNAQLRQLDKAKSEFLSIASHQLRTPISAIKGYLSMLIEGDFGKIPDQQLKIIKDLFESSSRLARLINIFLNVSRIESGRFKLDRTTVNINDLVASVIKELTGQAQQKGIGLAFTPQPDLPVVSIDSDKIREVILNLVDNAIKYTPKGSVAIKTFGQDNSLCFSISDTGVGIRSDEVKSLFRKFVRGTGIAQVNTQGSGLGLYIAQRVITEHGGRIWAESAGVHKGSTFQFALPISLNMPPKDAGKASEKEKEAEKTVSRN